MSPPTLLDEADLGQLGEQGLVVKEGWLAEGACRELRAEALRVVAQGRVRPAGLRVTPGPPSASGPPATVRGDSTFWPADDDPGWALARGHFEALRDVLNAQAYLGLRRFELQLGHYPGNGLGYARHQDAVPGLSARRVTALLYLNPDWRPVDGGELRLFTASGEVDVAPRLGTGVVFLSEQVHHAVLPCFAPRLALTAWFYAS